MLLEWWEEKPSSRRSVRHGGAHDSQCLAAEDGPDVNVRVPTLRDSHSEEGVAAIAEDYALILEHACA